MRSANSFYIIFFLLSYYCCKSEVFVPPEHRFIAIRLNHFDRSDNRTWQQKFYVVGKYATNSNAPNILGLVDATKVEAHHVQKGLWHEQAKKLKTNLLVTDLRYFGFNRPTEDLSDENLKYFTIEQMVEDVISFIRAMNLFIYVRDSYHPRSQKWIVQGCGMAGALATFVRIKYPDLVVGAVAIGATPLVPTWEYVGFYQNIIQSIKEKSPKCVENIREGFRQIDSISKSTSGAQQIGDNLELCSSIADQSILNEKDVSILSFFIARFLSSAVKGRDNVLKISPIHDICRIINDKSRGSANYRIAQAHEFLRLERNQYCTPLYNDFINRIKDVSYTSQEHQFLPYIRQWKYIQCFGGGTFMTARNVEYALYGNRFNLTFMQGICKDAFPNWSLEQLQNKVAESKSFLEKTMPTVTNVAFVHEKSDPYRSIQYWTTNRKSYNIDITGTGNCEILNEDSLFDPLDVQVARKKLTNLLETWGTEDLQN